jgi:hypothetical protein
MISVEELAGAFENTRNIAPWGQCVVVKMSDWLVDWEKELADQGTRVRFGSFGSEYCVFVPLAKAAAESKVVYVPPKIDTLQTSVTQQTSTPIQSNLEVKNTDMNQEKEKTEKKHGGWLASYASEEDAYITQLYNEGKKLSVIGDLFNAKYPNRTSLAVQKHIGKMQNAGLLKLRNTKSSESKRAASDALKKEIENGIKDSNSTNVLDTKKEPDVTDTSKEVSGQPQTAKDFSMTPKTDCSPQDKQEIEALKKEIKFLNETLSQIYDAFSSGFLKVKVDLQEIQEQQKSIQEQIQKNATFSAQTEEKVIVDRRILGSHKHDKETGETQIPLKMVKEIV